MTELSAEDAAHYALQRDVLLLVGATVAGAIFTGLGLMAMGSVHAGWLIVVFQNLFGVLAILVGLVLQIVGGVGLLYKIISDAT